MDTVTTLVLLLISALVFTGFGWWLGKKSSPSIEHGPSEEEIKEKYVSRELYQREADVAMDRKAELEQANGIILELNKQLSTLESEQKNLEKRHREHLEEVQSLRDEFYKQFKLTAQELMEKNAESFQKRSGEHMNVLLSPLKEKLTSFEKQVQDTYDKGQRERIELKTEVKKLVEQNHSLKEEAQNLARALKGDVKVQGNWGEVILERLLESSGLKKGTEYETQSSHTNEDGKRVQPDVVIHLPDDKYLIIDSKVSLVGYERLANAETDEDRETALKEHLVSIRAHIKGLSEKKYQQIHADRSPDFVLLFIPIEGAFNVALQSDQRLYQDAWDKNIVIVSTTTLLATLRTIASIWKQENQANNIRLIAVEGAKLYDKIAGFVDDMKKLGDQMDTTRKTYEKAIGKLSEGRGNIISKAEKMKELGLETTKSIPTQFLNENDDE